MKLTIEQIDNYWTVNGKRFTEMSDSEKEILVKFLKTIHERTINQFT